MEYVKLGQSDLSMSRLGFGCWLAGGHGWGSVSEADSIAAIKHSLDLGVTYFDTADVYGFGYSETLLSKALGNKRHQVIIGTKGGVAWDSQARIARNNSAKYICSAVEQSLQRLSIDAIPLYQIHWPDGVTPIAETMGALERLREQGKVLNIGCSNFDHDLFVQACQLTTVVSHQLPHSLLVPGITDKEHEVYAARKISVLAYGVLAKGLLTGKYSTEPTFPKDDNRSRDPNFRGDRFKASLDIVEKLRTVGSRYGKSTGQTAIRWALDNAVVSCAIVGIRTSDQIRQAAGALNWKLSEEDSVLLRSCVTASS